MVFKDDSEKNKPKVALDGINTKEFEDFLTMQKNLSDATVKNHVQYLGIFLQSVGEGVDGIGISDIQDFMLKIKSDVYYSSKNINGIYMKRALLG
jgi:hypothetical protein